MMMRMGSMTASVTKVMFFLVMKMKAKVMFLMFLTTRMCSTTLMKMKSRSTIVHAGKSKQNKLGPHLLHSRPPPHALSQLLQSRMNGTMNPGTSSLMKWRRMPNQHFFPPPNNRTSVNEPHTYNSYHHVRSLIDFPLQNQNKITINLPPWHIPNHTTTPNNRYSHHQLQR